MTKALDNNDFLKGFGYFPVSRHFNFSKVSRNMKNNQILWENHYCQGILSFLLFLDTFWIQKGLETKNDRTPWKNHYFLGFFLFLDNFFTNEMSRNMINNKVAWINDFPKGFCHFFCFWTFYCIQKCLETGQQKHPLTFSISSNSCTIRPSRAPQARGKAWEVYPL